MPLAQFRSTETLPPTSYKWNYRAGNLEDGELVPQEAIPGATVRVRGDEGSTAYIVGFNVAEDTCLLYYGDFAVTAASAFAFEDDGKTTPTHSSLVEVVGVQQQPVPVTVAQQPERPLRPLGPHPNPEAVLLPAHSALTCSYGPMCKAKSETPLTDCYGKCGPRGLKSTHHLCFTENYPLQAENIGNCSRRRCAPCALGLERGGSLQINLN